MGYPTPEVPKKMVLPNGQRTTSFFAYCDAWTSVGRLVEERSGWILEEFDPEFVFLAPSKEARIRLPQSYVLHLVKDD